MDRTRDIGFITKEQAIGFGLSGPNLRGSGVDHDLRKKHPYLDYENYDFEVAVGTVGDCYDRYLVRLEEMRQSVRILEQALDKMPDGPINVVDGKNILPPKQAVLMKMEELIHHFMVVTQGIDAPVGEVYFGAENPKGELGFYINSRGGGVPVPAQDPRPVLCQPEHSPDDPARPHDERRGRHPGQPRFRHGRVRPLIFLQSDP